MSSKFKVVVLGSNDCGKSGIVRAWIKGQYDIPDPPEPISVFERRITLPHRQNQLTISLWDSKKENKTRYFLFDTNVAIVAFDTTRKVSFDKALTLIDEYAEFVNGFFVLIGTKADLEGHVSDDIIDEYCRNNKDRVKFGGYVSAKESRGISELFERIGMTLSGISWDEASQPLTKCASKAE